MMILTEECLKKKILIPLNMSSPKLPIIKILTDYKKPSHIRIKSKKCKCIKSIETMKYTTYLNNSSISLLLKMLLMIEWLVSSKPKKKELGTNVLEKQSLLILQSSVLVLAIKLSLLFKTKSSFIMNHHIKRIWKKENNLNSKKNMPWQLTSKKLTLTSMFWFHSSFSPVS